MIAVRWKKVLRDLLGSRSRTILVVLSIAVGIFATGAILGARQVLLREFETDFAHSLKASITFNTTGVDQSVVDKIALRNDVLATEGQYLRFARLRLVDGVASDSDMLSSWDALEFRAFPSFPRTVHYIEPLNVQSWPPQKGDIFIENSANAIFDYKIGDTVEIDTGTKIAQFRVAGFVHDINSIPARFFRQVTAYTTTDSLPLLDEPIEYNIVDIRVREDLPRTEVSRIANEIKDQILEPAGVYVTSTNIPNPGSHFFGDIFKAVSVLLLGMALMALTLSGFLVVTTVSAILVQHTRQLGIMKAIGGRRWQIASLYFGLVFGFGLFALVIGLPTGLLFGFFFTEYAADVLNFRILGYSFPAWVMVVLVCIGLVLPVITASIPIISGVKRPIVDAFNANALLPNFGEGWVDRLLGKIRWLPRPTALALRTTFTRKGRLAMTLITLSLAAGVVMAVFTARTSLMQTVDDIGSWWHYDAQVMLSRPMVISSIEAEAKRVTGVRYAEVWTDGFSIINRPDGTKNDQYFTMGVPADSRVVNFQFIEGRFFEPGEKGVILNNELYNEEEYLRLGQDIDLDIAGKRIKRQVIGVVTGSLQGPRLYFERDDLADLIGIAGNGTRVFTQMDDSMQGPLERGLLGLGRPRLDQTMTGIRAFNQQMLADNLERAFDGKGYAVSDTETSMLQLDDARGQLGILITFLIIMASALAAVGIIGLSGSMTLSVIESTREIGIMRAIGAGHRSIFAVYVTQGLVVGTISWFIGAVIAVPISWALMQSLIGALGMSLAYRYSFTGIVVCLVLVWVISALGSLLPAWAASQVSIRDAISYE